MNRFQFSTLFLLLFCSSLQPQTIEEKKEAFAFRSSQGEKEVGQLLTDVNFQLNSLKGQLDLFSKEALEILKRGGPEEDYKSLLEKINSIKSEMLKTQNHWREVVVAEAKKDEEGYALWDQEETTLAQLVMEYGASDYLYIVPPELTNIKLNLHSNIPIPREAWGDVLEIILSHNGIGVKRINPYARQLFILKQDPSSVQAVASKPQDLQFSKNQDRIFYIFSPPPEQVKSTFQFFERFSDPKQSFVYQVGGRVAVVASKEEIEKLIALYHTIWQDPQGKISRVISVTKMNVKEMEKILHSFFGDAVDKATGRAPFVKTDHEGLSIFTPSQGNALVLLGSKEIVDRAEKIIRDTEEQLQDPAEMTVFLYSCKHSDPTDLAKILDRVYYSLIYALPENRESSDMSFTARGQALQNPPDGYAPNQPLQVPPQTFKPEISTKLEVEQESDNFIPDPKTGNLLMVVRRDTMPKIKDLLRKLDVPKKMVQIEVLLFEKKLNYQSNYGLNLLKLGSKNGMRYDGPNPPGPRGLNAPVGNGVLSFLFSGDKSKYFPAFDVAYSFLMTQEDIQLNAAPSVITVNQTPATISILEEISINNGAAPIDTNKGVAFEKSFSRAQYGITIILTPIVHLPDDEDQCEKGFVTLQTNITFDTTKTNPEDRPTVDRRHIENEVRVADGETIILGGLRRKATEDSKDMVPFLGEIPGIGKLFGSSQLTDHNTEMFFFITPKIVLDPKQELIELRREELKKRPGDLPEFLEEVIQAQNREQKKLFSQTLRMFFRR